MVDALTRFFTASYAPHGYCLLWQPALVWTHVIADAAIAISYFSIPVALIALLRRRRDIEFGWIFGLFALFILACGATHLMAIWTLWNGDYGVEAMVKVVTAIASVATAGVLWPLIPRLVELPSPSALRATNLKLAETIAERDRALAAMATEIDQRQRAEAALVQAQKLEAMGQLTGGIAHDFNNLLQAVGGNLELIAQRPADTARVTRWSASALQAVDRGRRLTGQLLAFSRVQKLALTTVALRPLLAGMTDLLERSLGPMMLLDVALPAPDLAAVGDPMQLELAILNLAINARDAMPTGGTVRIEARAVTLDTHDDLPPGDYVAIDVRDTGVGMSPETVARAADPFFTTKELGKGTGLGLSMVFGVVAQSGGTVSIDSTPGGGTTVRLLLRRSRAENFVEAAAPVTVTIAASLAGLTIMLVDDDEDVRRSLSETIANVGATVIEAADGAAGLERLASTRADLLIVDFAMPGMNGAEVASRARAMHPALPIIVVSGYAESAALDAIAGPAIVVLRKPCPGSILLETIGRLLTIETV